MDTSLPSKIAAGTTVEYTRSSSDYPADQGWSLKLHIQGASELHVDAVAVGADYLVTLTAAQTAALEAGPYQYVEQVTHTDGRVFNLADLAPLEVTPDLATGASGEYLVAIRTLKLIRDIIAGKVDDLKAYTIGTRSAELFTFDELIRAERYWYDRVQSLKPGNKGRIGSMMRTTYVGMRA